MKEPLHLTSLNRFELENAIQLALFRKTILPRHSQPALAALEDDLATGAAVIVPCDWAAVHSRALGIARQYARKAGHRAFDILHIATALDLEAKEFLTFDAKQSALAKAMGLKVKT